MSIEKQKYILIFFGDRADDRIGFRERKGKLMCKAILALTLAASISAAGDSRRTFTLTGVRITAYCICEKCCGKAPDHPLYGVTATGHKVKDGDRIVAVDRRLIPLYSTVIIGGVSYLALDTGGAIKGRRIDVLVTGTDAHRRAMAMGVRRGTVVVQKRLQKRASGSKAVPK